MNTPAVSIVMPVYNAERFLPATLKAALAQTFTDFELIVVDDGSSDASAACAGKTGDPRVRVLVHPVNQGVSAATNTGFAAARGTYIALMDHDDLSFPDRLQKQVALLEAHPELDGCGGGHVTLSRWAFVDTLKAQAVRIRRTPVSPAQVACESLWGGALFNPTVCFRRSLLSRLDHWWDSRFSVGADDEFYGRLLASGARLCVLPDAVLRYRRHSGNLSRRSRKKALEARSAIALAGLARLLPEASEAQKRLHVAIALRDRTTGTKDLDAIKRLLLAMLEANNETALFEKEALKRVMARHWSRVCALAGCEDLRLAYTAYYGFAPLRAYLGSPLFLLYQWQKRRFRFASGLHGFI